MRPLTLKMTAFGPYKNTEKIDFADLQGNQLFVISGSTGSGKTTIFDGICFALYGAASGSDRSESRILRSDFAEDTVHTAVEMEFEIHDKRYRVLRQMSHVKKGNKSPTGERYEFVELTAEGEKPAVERQIVSEINRRIEEIVGLTQNQFSQIVMLPQGEFRKLLTSETDNKEEILRKIFKTEPYKLISERLKQKRDAAEKIVSQQQQSLAIYMQRITDTLPERDSELVEVLSREHNNTNQVLQALENEKRYYQQKRVTDEEKREKAYQFHADKLSAYHEAKEWNGRFNELHIKNEQLKQVEQRQPEFAKKEQVLQAAERASYIASIENSLQELQLQEIKKNNLLEQALVQQEKAGKSQRAAETVYHEQQQLQSERERLSEQLRYLDQLLPTIQELNHKEKNVAKLKEIAAQFATQLTHISEQADQKKHEKQQLTEKISSLEAVLSSADEQQQELAATTEKHRVVREYVLLEQQQQQLQKIAKDKKKAVEEVAGAYRQLESQWLANQAHFLAEQLHDGQACPVCGSVEHPGAQLTNTATVITKEQVEAAKTNFERVDGEHRNASAKLLALQEQLAEKTNELHTLKIESEQAAEQLTALAQTKQQLTEKMQEQQIRKSELRQWKEQLASSIEKVEQVEDAKQELAKQVQQHSTSFQTAQAVFESELATVPVDLRELAVLQERLQQTAVQKQKLEQDWTLAQEQYHQTKEQVISAGVSVEYATDTAKETKEKRVKAQQQFDEALAKSSFISEQVYQQAKMTETAFAELKKEMVEFAQMHHTLLQQVKELNELLANHQWQDLSQAEVELSQLKEAYEAAFAECNQSKAYEKIATDLIDSIGTIVEKTLEVEENFHRIADLHNMIRGQNGLKISFERYLQIEYLEQIILSANERLKNLSNGQFYLIRSDRQEARGKQSGLGLDVYDAYTGQTRDVKTMSGGEKFNASLCLALGMADVIQSFQGNVSIDTMFIDEGFGSLDEESLNKSIETLIDLQKSGRMIGVISHVQELKAAIPAILHVEKSKEGYSHTKFLIK